MTKISFQRYTLVYGLLVMIDLVAIQFEYTWLHIIAKPLLMPVLMLLLLHSGVAATGRKLIAMGLLFSWMGDVFLLFEPGNALFFIPGLVSFLITHCCYIIYFLSTGSVAISLLKKQPFYILLVLCYGTGLIWLLFPYLGQLKFPVILYAAIICSMLLCSIHIYLKVKEPFNCYYVSGAILFVLSDSILAVNKFYQHIPLAGIWLMMSYCAAQYFIVMGSIGMSIRVK